MVCLALPARALRTSPPIPEDAAVEHFPEDTTLRSDAGVAFPHNNPPSSQQRWEQCSPAPAFSLTPGSGAFGGADRTRVEMMFHTSVHVACYGC